jgi:hypothetical protein
MTALGLRSERDFWSRVFARAHLLLARKKLLGQSAGLRGLSESDLVAEML